MSETEYQTSKNEYLLLPTLSFHNRIRHANIWFTAIYADKLGGATSSCWAIAYRRDGPSRRDTAERSVAKGRPAG